MATADDSTHEFKNPLLIALAGAVTMAIAMGFGRFSYTPILPGMIDGLGLTASQAGLIASANYLGYLFGAIAAAYIAVPRQERRIALSGLLLTCVLLFAMSSFETVTWFSIVRFLAGWTSAFVMIFTTSIVVSNTAGPKGSLVQAIHFGGVGAGIAISAAMVGGLTLQGYGWPALWTTGAVICVCGFVLVAWLLPPMPKRASGSNVEPKIKWSPGLIALTISYGIFGFGYIITATFIVTIVRAGGPDIALETAVWLVTGISAAVSVVAWLPIVRRIGLMNTYLWACGVEMLGVAASVLVPMPLGPLLGGLLLGFTFIVVTAYGLQIGRQVAPESPRRVIAVMTAAFGLGQVIGPVLAGYLADLSGSFTSASIAAAIGLAFCVLLLLPFRRFADPS